MNMRRYSMKARRVTALKRLLRNDRITVKRIAIAAHEKKEDMVYIFYEDKEETLAKNTQKLKSLRAIANEVRDNTVYQKLTNAKQKSLFLCDTYRVTKSEAEDIVELVKVINVEEWVREEEERTNEEATAAQNKMLKQERKKKEEKKDERKKH